MKYAHLVKVTVFSYVDENSDKIEDSLLKLFPFNLEENKIVLKKTGAAGFNEKKIIVFEVRLEKNNLINKFLENLNSNLDKNQKTIILLQKESRLDDELDFFLRFDKDLWINDEKLELTDTGKCFHIKMSIAAFPKKRENGLKIVKDMFS